MSPRVSVGMPIHNGARFLAETLDSWLAQDLEDFELVASDNGSTDDTPRILEDYARRDSRLRVVRRSEKVIAWENYNGLVPQASAPLFAWAACDDLRHPSFLRRLSEALEADPEAILAYCYLRYFGDPRREHRHPAQRGTPPGEQPKPLARAISFLRVREAGPFYGLIRSDVLRKTRLCVWPMGFTADTGLILELATYGRMRCVPEELMSFRLHEDSLSMTPEDPVFGGRRGRLVDDDVVAFVEGLPLEAREKHLLLREIAAWCAKAQKPRRGLWRLSGFRSAYTRVARARIDISRTLHGL